MERYTRKHYGENGYYIICSENCETLNCGDCGILDKIVDRLAAYEDTELSPEEIIELKGRMDNKELAEIAMRLVCPCDVCMFNPPSSTDGKPCSMCPASPVKTD